VANHFFDLSPHLFAEVADSYNKQNRSSQVLRVINKDVGSATTSTAAEPYSSPRPSLVSAARQVIDNLFNRASSSQGASVHNL
jgi:hypothetical protein